MSNRLTDYFNQDDNEEINLIADEFDVLIKRENLKIVRFTWIRELDLALLVLNNRRIISYSLSDYPSLAGASDEALTNYTISTSGIHWPMIDADLSLRGLLMSEVIRGVNAV